MYINFTRVVAVLYSLFVVGGIFMQSGCFPRPLDLQLTDASDNKPVEGVTIHRHSVTLLSLLATDSNAVQSGPGGEARIWVPPFNTKLTLLQSGFEPATIDVFNSKTTDNMLVSSNSAHQTFRFQDLDEKTTHNMKLAPVKFVPIQVRVVEKSNGDPIDDAEISATTFLYLPMPGIENRWGFPDLQTMRSDSDGHTQVSHASGFRNVLTVRKPGYQEVRQDLDASNSESELLIQLRQLQKKTVQFKVLNSESNQPIPNVVVRLNEQRNGLASGPNEFAVVSNEDGFTPLVPIQNMMPLVIETECAGYHRFSLGLDWRALKDGEVIKVNVRKKGWFE
jgi:hypothetical protein